MLELTTEKVSELKKQVFSDDEDVVRKTCGFRKDVSKYPILYKEVSEKDPVPESHVVSYMAIIGQSQFPKMSSLLIQLDDGRWSRVCAAYLNEMQSAEYGMPDLSMNALSDDDLFS